MVGMSPTPEDVAQQLLRHVLGEDISPTVFMAGAEVALGELRAGLSSLMGPAGFDSIWRRALALVAPSDVGCEGYDARVLEAAGWLDVCRGQPLDELRALVMAAFTSFIRVWFTFVGAEIGARLLAQAVPRLAGASTGAVPSPLRANEVGG